jgi:hypothetical protein
MVNRTTFLRPSIKQIHQQMDAYVGGLAERPILRGAIPPTFSTLIKDYFTRIRAADRFHFENPGVLSESELKEVQTRTLSDMVRDHTDIEQITDNMFGMQTLTESAHCAAPGTDQGGTNGSDPTGGSSGSYTVTDGLDVAWQVLLSTNRIRFTLVSTVVSQNGWLGIGIGSNKMIGADFHIGHFVDGVWQVVDGHSPSGGNVDIDSENSLTIGESSYVDGTMTIVFERPLTATTGEEDVAIIENDNMDVIFACSNDAFPSYHGFSKKYVAQLTLWSSSGTGPGTTQSPGGYTGHVGSPIELSLIIHGVSMFLIWLVFIPLGIYFVRFRKG